MREECPKGRGKLSLRRTRRQLCAKGSEGRGRESQARNDTTRSELPASPDDALFGKLQRFDRLPLHASVERTRSTRPNPAHQIWKGGFAKILP